MKKIIHFSTLHPRSDTRIRIKETATLAAHLDAEVFFFVQDGKGNDLGAADGVKTIDTGAPARGRLARMTKGSWRMYRAVRRARPDIAHFHDPELIPVALLLKLSGIKIIYDVHEDLPRQILDKFWISPVLRKPVAYAAALIEWIAGKSFDHIILAAPVLSRRFPARKSTVIFNYPKLGELTREDSIPYQERRPLFAYVGGITKTRGSLEMVRAMSYASAPDAKLALGGPIQPETHLQELEQIPEWTRTEYLGILSRAGVAELLGTVRAGLVVLHPTDSYLASYPVKMYEYMMVGLPIIASDFPLWRSILDGVDCAVFVDPENPAEISDAMNWILHNPEEAEKMGMRGQNAVKDRFNWEREAESLLAVYRKILTKGK